MNILKSIRWGVELMGMLTLVVGVGAEKSREVPPSMDAGLRAVLTPEGIEVRQDKDGIVKHYPFSSKWEIFDASGKNVIKRFMGGEIKEKVRDGVKRRFEQVSGKVSPAGGFFAIHKNWLEKSSYEESEGFGGNDLQIYNVNGSILWTRKNVDFHHYALSESGNVLVLDYEGTGDLAVSGDPSRFNVKVINTEGKIIYEYLGQVFPVHQSPRISTNGNFGCVTVRFTEKWSQNSDGVIFFDFLRKKIHKVKFFEVGGNLPVIHDNGLCELHKGSKGSVVYQYRF